MANLYDASQSPQVEPQQMVVGDFVQWRRTDLSSDYPNTAYSLTYVARSKGGAHEIQISSTAYQSDFLFTVASATSANWIAADYFWQLEVIRTSDSSRIVLERGQWKIIADLDAYNTDTRTFAEVMVDKIESILRGKADSDVANYSVAGRSLTKLSFDELIRARDEFRREVAKEQAELRIARKQDTGATIKVRFL